jgi:hypothetical protein
MIFLVMSFNAKQKDQSGLRSRNQSLKAAHSRSYVSIFKVTDVKRFLYKRGQSAILIGVPIPYLPTGTAMSPQGGRAERAGPLDSYCLLRRTAPG